MDDLRSLQLKIRQLDNELTQLRVENSKLESEVKRLKGGGPADVSDLPMAVTEFEETLRRLVQRTAMIVQAEKCVIMVRDRESGDLFARSPAFGMTPEEVEAYRIPLNCGVSGAVFRSGQPAIFHNVDQDSLAIEENFTGLRVRNGVTVPLMIERRNDENHIVDRLTIGVLHCLNKRYGGEFIEEDVRLLERLSRNAAAVIANAQMFQEIVEEKQKLVHTLESLTAGLILVNQHGRIGQMNAQARAMFGVAEDLDPIGKTVEEAVKHEMALQIIKHKVFEVLSTGHTTDEEHTTESKPPDEISVLDKDEDEYIYQVHGACVHEDSGKLIGTVIIFNDITDIRNVERMKTEFVSIVSHELRTPLTPMKGFIRTLLDDENEEWYAREDRREFYGIIEENIDRLSRLINDLLNVSRIEKMGAKGLDMEWTEVDIRKATESVVMVQKARTDKHTLVLDFEPETILAQTDADKIQNILHNLISNAIKYSPEGGEVRIIARIEPAHQDKPEMLLMGIKDQGLGIPASMLKKLGDKFIRVKHSVKIGGTGIGLYLVKNLIEAHGGKFWPESEGVGKGSTFWFRIPVHRPATEDPTA